YKTNKTQMCLKLLTDTRDSTSLHVKLHLQWVTSIRFLFKYFNVVMHSVNAVFLRGQTFLNSLLIFPLFMISYFV
ncbi:hypothetical protein HID58_072938, partial [Brassica napus]